MFDEALVPPTTVSSCGMPECWLKNCVKQRKTKNDGQRNAIERSTIKLNSTTKTNTKTKTKTNTKTKTKIKTKTRTKTKTKTKTKTIKRRRGFYD